MHFLILIGFIATIPAANWLIGNVGVVCVPEGPCLIPVWPGIMAPSGVMMIGAALVLRDAVHEYLGVKWAIAAVLTGALLSGLVAPAALVVASGAAFLFSEMADLSVYAPLRKRRLWLAVLASGIVGSIVDSGLFLWLAFGSLDFIAGNVIGKLWMSIAAVPFVLWGRRIIA
jgi:uncharacterized PurR-regulated membrane protein YhhQ (DUF165 family)